LFITVEVPLALGVHWVTLTEPSVFTFTCTRLPPLVICRVLPSADKSPAGGLSQSGSRLSYVITPPDNLRPQRLLAGNRTELALLSVQVPELFVYPVGQAVTLV